jgi:hypothetical protein
VLVVVIAVFGVAVAVVEVVHMIAVLHGLMRAIAAAMRVLGKGMFCFHFFGHDGSFGAAAQLRRPPGCGSRVWAMVSRMTWGEVGIGKCVKSPLSAHMAVTRLPVIIIS